MFVVLRLLAIQTLFINAMTTRSVMANEQIRQSTDTQTQAISGQTMAMVAMNTTSLATGQAVADVDKKVELLLAQQVAASAPVPVETPAPEPAA